MLSVLYVKGRKIPHFKKRQSAAQMIAAITGKKATYLGLTGEEIDSARTPRNPYRNQDRLIAGFLLDHIESAGIPAERPQSDYEWQRLNVLHDKIQRLVRDDTEGFGSALKKELLAESRRRDIHGRLKALNFSVWR